ncbi:MAG TPA: hydroxyisourate hydrolase [Gaiellaceae bacterium]|jgi:5-hydroxyisourate hydrolase
MSASLSTHVLDLGQGAPAAGIRVELLRNGDIVAAGETDGDGRIGDLGGTLEAGTYQLVFHPASSFFRRVELELDLEDRHHHVPLLVSPFGCASYRGS